MGPDRPLDAAGATVGGSTAPQRRSLVVPPSDLRLAAENGPESHFHSLPARGPLCRRVGSGGTGTTLSLRPPGSVLAGAILPRGGWPGDLPTPTSVAGLGRGDAAGAGGDGAAGPTGGAFSSSRTRGAVGSGGEVGGGDSLEFGRRGVFRAEFGACSGRSGERGCDVRSASLPGSLSPPVDAVGDTPGPGVLPGCSSLCEVWREAEGAGVSHGSSGGEEDPRASGTGDAPAAAGSGTCRGEGEPCPGNTLGRGDGGNRGPEGAE